MKPKTPEIIEDRSRCDHPLEFLELHSTKEFNEGESMAPTCSTFAAIFRCRKCDSYVLVHSDYCSWHPELYSKLMEHKGLMPTDEYPWYGKDTDPDQEQMRFLYYLDWLLTYEGKGIFVRPDILKWAWRNKPKEMAAVVAMLTESAVTANIDD